MANTYLKQRVLTNLKKMANPNCGSKYKNVKFNTKFFNYIGTLNSPKVSSLSNFEILQYLIGRHFVGRNFVGQNNSSGEIFVTKRKYLNIIYFGGLIFGEGAYIRRVFCVNIFVSRFVISIITSVKYRYY